MGYRFAYAFEPTNRLADALRKLGSGARL